MEKSIIDLLEDNNLAEFQEAVFKGLCEETQPLLESLKLELAYTELSKAQELPVFESVERNNNLTEETKSNLSNFKTKLASQVNESETSTLIASRKLKKAEIGQEVKIAGRENIHRITHVEILPDGRRKIHVVRTSKVK